MKRDHRRHPTDPRIQVALNLAAAFAISILAWALIFLIFITF